MITVAPLSHKKKAFDRSRTQRMDSMSDLKYASNMNGCEAKRMPPGTPILNPIFPTIFGRLVLGVWSGVRTRLRQRRFWHPHDHLSGFFEVNYLATRFVDFALPQTKNPNSRGKQFC